LPKEFLEFVVENKYSEKHSIPFLNDLLNFEWAEMELYNTTDIPYEYGSLTGNVINDIISVNPEHLLVPLHYPVHLLPPLEAIDKKGNYFVLLFREKETGKIQFIDLSVWYAFIIEQISQQEISIAELMNYVPQLFGNVSTEELKTNTELFMQSMIDKKFIIEIK
jgi:hypothetical protein